MANRNFANSRIYTGHVMPVLLDCNIAIGSTGAVGTVKGPYVTSVTRLGVGAYQIKLNDNYSLAYNVMASLSVAPTGSNINLTTGLTIGQAYIITAVGTSTTANWQTAGLPAGITPAVGVGFVAITAAAGTGTGTVKAVAPSGIVTVEAVGNQSLTSAPDPAVSQGAVILIQCYGSTSSSVTTLIPADPANGSTLFVEALMSNSSITINGE